MSVGSPGGGPGYPPYGSAPTWGGPPVYSPPSYGPPGYGPPGYGPVGRIRPTGVTVLLFILTFGIYSYFYNYSVHEEMKRHTGRGIGGGVALILSFFAAIAMPFVTPNEVGNMYALRGQPKPVRAWTGLWAVIPVLVGLVVFIATFATVFATATYRGGTDSYGDPDRVPVLHGGQIAALVIGGVSLFAFGVGGQLVSFVKTNGALNRYWAALGVTR